MKLNIDPFNRGNPMTLKDAAVVSTLAATAIMILNVIASATVGQVRADPLAFCFELAKAWLVAWAGNFVTLSGLEIYISRTRKEE